MHYKQTQHFGLVASGFNIVELFVILGLMGVLSILGLKLLVGSPKDAWPRVMEDYTRQLAAVYNKIKLENGDTPLKAIDNSTINNPVPTLLYADGIATLLSGNNTTPARPWETATTYTARTGTVPSSLQYPSKIVLYLDPEDTHITDASSQLPIHQAAALAPDNPVTAVSPQTVMANTDDREWLLVDMNGVDAPNDLGTTGDRVLLIVDDSTGRILTAWQKCWMQLNPIPNQSAPYNGIPYGAGNTCTMGPATTPAFPAPTRIYYKTFFDTYKNYTGSY